MKSLQFQAQPGGNINWIYLEEEIELGSNNDFLQDTFMH